MRKSKKKSRIYAFIDSQNLNLAIRDQGWILDFQKFYVYLKDKYNVDKVFIFIGYVAGNKSLYAFLRKSGYKIIFKPTLKYKKGGIKHTKGNVDAELVLHAMIEYPNYDKAIIVSGDGDFYCLIEYLLVKNKLEKVIIPNFFKFSALLRKFMNRLVFLNSLKNKLKNQKRGINLRTKP